MLVVAHVYPRLGRTEESRRLNGGMATGMRRRARFDGRVYVWIALPGLRILGMLRLRLVEVLGVLWFHGWVWRTAPEAYRGSNWELLDKRFILCGQAAAMRIKL